MIKKKGMSIDIGIKRLSILRDQGLISDRIFCDSKELLLQSEMEKFLASEHYQAVEGYVPPES